MECVSHGVPASPILWKSLKNNQFIKPHHYNNYSTNFTSYLVINKPTINDTGNYSCEIPGQLNQKKIFQLIIQAKPSKPLITIAEVFATDRTRILWYLETSGDAPILNILIEWSTQSTFTKSELIRNHSSY